MFDAVRQWGSENFDENSRTPMIDDRQEPAVDRTAKKAVDTASSFVAILYEVSINKMGEW
jgi:hypothetical protein